MSNQEENFVIDELSPDGKWLCVFEDDGETGYLYFCPMSSDGKWKELLMPFGFIIK